MSNKKTLAVSHLRIQTEHFSKPPENKVIVNFSSKLQIICRYAKLYESIWNYTGDSHNLVTISLCFTFNLH